MLIMVITLITMMMKIMTWTIMVTGAIREKVVFGQYLLAPAFFWEDVFSFGVIFLQTRYIYALFAEWASSTQMWIALAAYGAYCIHAFQFVWKLRAARLQAEAEGALA